MRTSPHGTTYTTRVVAVHSGGAPLNRHYVYATAPNGETTVLGCVSESSTGVTGVYYVDSDPANHAAIVGTGPGGRLSDVRAGVARLAALHRQLLEQR